MIEKKLLLFAALFLAGCTADPAMEGTESGVSHTAAARKILNDPAQAASGSLIVYFNDDAAATIEASNANASSTKSRSGVVSVDAVLSDIGVASLDRVFTVNPRTEERTRAAGLHKWYVVTFDQNVDLSAAALQLASVSEVQRVQFNMQMKRASDGKVTMLSRSGELIQSTDPAPTSFNDPLLYRQWHYINRGDLAITQNVCAGADINAGEAWKLVNGNPKVVVAVVDEGVKYSHPDLAANMWVNKAEETGAADVDEDSNGFKDDIHGYNFVKKGAISWTDRDAKGDGDSGHGTHVAGTVAAVNNNGLGVCGVAGGTGNGDGVRIMSCQVFSGTLSGSGSAAVVASALKYAADNGAVIAQCSFGYPAGAIKTDNAYATAKGVEKEAIDYFIATKNCDAIDGGLVIFAAGNDETAVSGYPGAYNKCISVTGISPDYLPAYYTNYGPGCNIAAPGGDAYISRSGSLAEVLSTVPSELYNDDYGYMQGTSMACPHVSGVAALALSYALDKGKHFTVDQFKTMIYTSVNDLDRHLDGTKESKFTMQLSDYYKKMGTGAIDAYQLLLQVDGTPCLKVAVDGKQLIPLTQFFGGAAANLTYLSAEMSQADMTKLGMETAPSFSYGKLSIKCTKPGVARITVKAIAGGNTVGGGNAIGGSVITKKFAVVVRGVNSGNGGWL